MARAYLLVMKQLFLKRERRNSVNQFIIRMLFAVLAGFFGALSSVFGKIATSCDEFFPQCNSSVMLIFLVFIVILMNVAMWYCLTIALSQASSASAVTGMNLGTNFMATVL